MKMDKDSQQNYLKLQMMNQQIQATQQQLQSIDKQEQQLLNTLESLDSFRSSKKDSEVFMPVATGIFAKAELKDTEKLIVNVGANTVIEMDVEHTKQLISQQIEELKKVYDQLSEELQKLGVEAHKLEHEVKGTKCEH